MGLSASKKVEKTLRESPEFGTVCNSVYEECLNLTQHAFSGVRPYQIFDASARLYLTLSTVNPLVKKWVPSPPSQTQVDKALKRFTNSGRETLDSTEFKAFAVELFRDAIISNAGKMVLQRVPLGIVGIAGIGIATGSGRDLVGTIMGVYTLGVATAVYLSLYQ